jgi:hypothetical protein
VLSVNRYRITYSDQKKKIEVNDMCGFRSHCCALVTRPWIARQRGRFASAQSAFARQTKRFCRGVYAPADRISCGVGGGWGLVLLLRGPGSSLAPTFRLSQN